MHPDPSASLWSDKTTPSLRGLDGRICPLCRRLFVKAANPAEIERCPDDMAALVEVRVFSESGEDPLLGLTVAGRFTVLSRLGAGSMGTVYRARQEGTARDVALKILRGERAYDASAKARFEREARANSLLASPYTVTVYDFGVAEDGSLFLAMELLEGESLGHRLRREGRLPVQEAVRFLREALMSLAEAHTKGIIHRDIKPDNLFLAKVPLTSVAPAGEICKVLDFGIAKLVRDEGGVDSLQTQAGTVFGTPRYMSPEQAQGKPLDARSDLYSLGIILYQMLCGRPPFEDEDAVLVMAQHIKAAPPSMSEIAPDAVIPPAIERVVTRTLSKDPSQRPASAEQFAELLDEALAVSAVDGSGVRRTMSSQSFAAGRSKTGLYVALGAGVFVLSSLVGWLLFGRDAAPREVVLAAPAASAALPDKNAAPAPTTSAAEVVLDLDIAGLPDADDDKVIKKHSGQKPLVEKPRGVTTKAAPAAETAAPAETTKPSKYGRFDLRQRR